MRTPTESSWRQNKHKGPEEGVRLASSKNSKAAEIPETGQSNELGIEDESREVTGDEMTLSPKFSEWDG